MSAESQYPVTMTATGTTTLNLTDSKKGGLPLKCTATFTETLGWARTTPALSPAFSGCQSQKTGQSGTVTNGGCRLRLHIGSTIGETGKYDGTVGIECEAGKAITIVGDLCEITIGAQEARSTIELSNVAGSPGDVNINWNLSGLVYSVVKVSPFFCGFAETGLRENGDLTGSTTLTGKDAGGKAVGLTVEMG